MLHSIKFSFKMMKKRPLRMFLTLLQVAAGVASIIIVLSLVFAIFGDGGVEDKPTLDIQAGEMVIEDDGISIWTMNVFTDELVSAFENQSNYLEYLTVYNTYSTGLIEYDNLVYSYNGMYGVSPAYKEMVDLKMIEGNFFTQSDIDCLNKVVVISKEANEQLFGTESGIGRKIRHFDSREETEEEWKIIGIFSRENENSFRGAAPHFIAPYSQVGWYPHGSLRMTVKPGKLAEAKSELMMIFKHQYLEQAKDDSSDDSPKPDLLFSRVGVNNEGRKKFGKEFGLLFGSFAFVAVVVSSIGILSMMLVSIVERTREVGLRRSLGASRLQIMGQILTESVMLSFIGGLLGTCLSFILVKPIMNDFISTTTFFRYLDVQAKISLYPVLISLGSILIVGVLAGLYPGFQAARIMPVEAIREN